MKIWKILLPLSLLYFLSGAIFNVWWKYDDGFDFYTFYVSGKAVLGGANPYRYDLLLGYYEQVGLEITDYPFVYPPMWLLVCALSALFPWNVTILLWKGVNLLLLLGSIYYIDRLYLKNIDRSSGLYPLICFMLMMSGTISLFFLGQTSLVVLFSVLCFFDSYLNGNKIMAGIAFSIALIKFHFLWPLGLFLLFHREWKAIFSTAFMILGSVVIIGLLAGETPISLVQSILEADLSGYETLEANELENPLSVGLPSLFYNTFGISDLYAHIMGFTLSFGALIYLLWSRNKALMHFDLAFLLYLGVIAFFARPYDLVLFFPLFACLLAEYDRSKKNIVLASILIATALVIPRTAIQVFYHRFLFPEVSEEFFVMYLQEYRSIVLTLLFISVLRIRSKELSDYSFVTK